MNTLNMVDYSISSLSVSTWILMSGPVPGPGLMLGLVWGLGLRCLGTKLRVLGGGVKIWSPEDNNKQRKNLLQVEYNAVNYNDTI